MPKTSFPTWFLYRTVPGRLMLSVLTRPLISRGAGWFLSSPLSRPLIKPYIRLYGLDMSLCEDTDFPTFNDCFTRRYRAEVRPLCPEEDALMSPCDGALSAYQIDDGLVLPVKQSFYRIADLVRDDALAEEFRDGICLVFRLQVTDLHRYLFIDDGRILSSRKIPGLLHTVRPIALREIPVFTENAREVTVMETGHLGRLVQVEVGAMMVGRIENNPVQSFVRGQEKGRFLFGGSTIILLLKKNSIKIKPGFFTRTEKGLETPVIAGEKLSI